MFRKKPTSALNYITKISQFLTENTLHIKMIKSVMVNKNTSADRNFPRNTKHWNFICIFCGVFVFVDFPHIIVRPRLFIEYHVAGRWMKKRILLYILLCTTVRYLCIVWIKIKYLLMEYLTLH